MPGDGDVADLVNFLGLLADPGRLRLLVALLEGEMCACDLAAVSGQSEGLVGHALRLRRAHRVVRARRLMRMNCYSLGDAHVRVPLGLALTSSPATTSMSLPPSLTIDACGFSSQPSNVIRDSASLTWPSLCNGWITFRTTRSRVTSSTPSRRPSFGSGLPRDSAANDVVHEAYAVTHPSDEP